MTRLAAAMTVSVLAVTVPACAPFGTAPLVVPISNNEWGSYEVLVYDASGLVTGAQPAAQPGVDGVVALPDGNGVEVGWTGGACSHRPTLHVSGSATELRIVVRNPADPQLLPFLPVGCPAVGVPLRVSISLSEPVEQDVVGLEVSY